MADSKITALTALTAADPVNDMFPVVDVSDTSMAASGTTKRISVNNILSSSPTASGALTVTGLVTAGSATITGALTIGGATSFPASVINTSGGNPVFTPTASTLFLYSGSSFLSIRNQANTQEIFNLTPAGVYTFGDGAGGTRMTLNSTGLGVGVSPDFKFVVNGTQAVPSTSGSSATDGSLRIGAPGTGLVIDTGVTAASAVYGWIQARSRTDYSSNFNLVLQPNGGNVGVGVTPSAWAAGFKVVQFGPGSAISCNTNASRCDVSANYFYDGANKFITASGYATNLTQENGNFYFYRSTATSGGAGAACTFTQAMTLDASGNLLVGTTTAAVNAGGLLLRDLSDCGQILFSNNSGVAEYVARFYYGSTPTNVGNITVASGGTTYGTTSDYRLKESVKPISGGLARVNALKPSVYNWKFDGSTGEGFLAHELAEVVPFAVIGEKDAVNADGTIKSQGIDMSRVVPILVAAIQELTARVQTLEAR